MHRTFRTLASTGLVAVAAGAFAAAGPVLAQAGGTAPAPAAAGARPAAQKPAAQRPAIRLAPAERDAIDAAQPVQPARVDDELAPRPEDLRPRAEGDPSTTRIEQHRVSNRVSEVVVTPAGQARGYVMTNREGRQPFGTTQMSSGGLSVPMFRFEFGRTTPPPATNPPPPPAPSPSR